MPTGLQKLQTLEVLLNQRALIGPAALRRMFDRLTRPDMSLQPSVDTGCYPTLRALIDELEAPGRGLIMTMGKGGVGKTTLAAAVAIALAERGHDVTLSTTDPAAHVSWFVSDAPANLSVERIDAEAETRAYHDEVMAAAGDGLDEAGRAMLLEDLRSPCTEEIAVFRAFARTVARANDRFVVLDTAPTGHTILLLDAAEAYHREVSRQSSDMPQNVQALLPRLRDPEFTRILLVTLPEATPVHEAARLQRDLARADIHPFYWVINQSILPIATSNPILSSRKVREHEYISEVTDRHTKSVVLVPWMKTAPTGAAALTKFVNAPPGNAASD